MTVIGVALIPVIGPLTDGAVAIVFSLVVVLGVTHGGSGSTTANPSGARPRKVTGSKPRLWLSVPGPDSLPWY